MKNKICLVTGANTGIGKATAEGLARQGAIVLMVCRNPLKGEAARQEIMERTDNRQVRLYLCDLSLLSQVRRLASHIRQDFNRIDVLVSNAAAFFTRFELTEEGFERQWVINHLSNFLLVNLLLDLVKKAAPARIIIVSSKGNYKGNIHFGNLNLQQGYTGLKAYRQSKLANVLFTYELARQLKGTGVTANTLHPGVVGTQIGYANNNSLPALVWRAGRYFMISAREGAATTLYLACSPVEVLTTGCYFHKCKPRPSARLSYDTELARRLWEESARQAGLPVRQAT